jgi:hypothetical protein
MYGATGAGEPYVTGAVVQGSHTGAAGGQAAATGAGWRNQSPQQQQPALPAVSNRASRSDILFIACASVRNSSVIHLTPSSGRGFAASDARAEGHASGLTTIPGRA